MSQHPVLPFTLKRSSEEFGAASMTTTTETVHGLVRIEGDELVVQWRLARRTDRYDSGISTDEEIEDVREVKVPLDALGGAVVRKRWWEFWRRPRIAITASDLAALDPIAGEDGLRLSHPAELVLGLRRGDRLLGEEFAADLELTLANRQALPRGGRDSLSTPPKPSLPPPDEP